MANYVTYRIPVLDGGYVTDISPRILDQTKGFMSSLRNVDMSSIGKVKKRPGTSTALTALASTCLGAFAYTKLSTSTEYKLAVAGTNLYKYVVATSTWSSIKSGLAAAGTTYDFLTYADKVAIVNGVDASMLFDGTTVTTPAAFPKGTMMAEWRGRIALAGIPSYPCLIRLSHAIDPTKWETDILIDPTTNATQFYAGPDDGEAVTGLLNTGEGGLLVGKPSFIYGIFGYTRPDMAIDLLDTSVGVGSHKSMIYSRPYAYFCGKQGVYRYSGGGKPERLSIPIQTVWDNDVDLTNLHLARAILHKKTYVLTVPVAAGGYMTLAYQIDRERWVGVWDHPQIRYSMCSSDVIYYTESSGASFYKVDPSTLADRGSAVEAVMETQEIDMDLPEVDKDVKDAYITFLTADNSYLVDVYINADDRGWETCMENFEVTGTTPGVQKVVRAPIGRTGRFFKLRIRNVNLNEDFQPLAVTLLYRPKEML